MINNTKFVPPSVIFHTANPRPIQPAVGTIYKDEASRYPERWNGSEWVPVIKAPS